MLLHERPASSRELGDRLVGLGLAAGDPAGIELVLTALARAGLTRPLGGDFVCPTYRLTAAGTERLAAANEDLRRTQVLLERFIARCAERIVPHGGAGLHEQHPSAP
jgi:hypothetical protein